VVAVAAVMMACGGSAGSGSPDSLFATPEAERAKELAPDLYRRAELASDRADETRGRKEGSSAEDYRAESELWLAAAVAEAERIELSRRLDSLQREEEQWARQLARDQEASAVVATDISRHRARAVALREAERVSALGDSKRTDEETLDAVLTRVRLNLALAEALGATESELRALRQRADSLSQRRSKSAKAAEALLLDTEALLGEMRAKWPAPRPGASTELVETAWATGFAADRTPSGVLVRSERFFTSSGAVSSATVKRFAGLMAAYPHGPVACQVAVPEVQSRVWSRRVAQLVDRFLRVDESGRLSTSMVETESLAAGTVQCTFAAYREP
jgi:hypothetical protein